MEKVRAIILGPQCSGKTTLKRYLSSKSALPLVEEDEVFTDLNDGVYPADIEYKEKTLRPKLEEKVRQSDDIVFLTSYCSPVLLKELKLKGFKILQLVLDEGEFNRRDERRIKEDGYENASIWSKEILEFHRKVGDEGLVDKVIDANQPIEVVAKEALEFLEISIK